jgi:hypothetical protein
MKLMRILATLLTCGNRRVAAPTLAGEPGRTPSRWSRSRSPASASRRPRKCGATTWKLLKHQRDRTLRQGIRGEPASLNACISCHASKKTGSVLGNGRLLPELPRATRRSSSTASNATSPRPVQGRRIETMSAPNPRRAFIAAAGAGVAGLGFTAIAPACT